MAEILFDGIDPAHLTRAALEANIARLSGMLAPQAGHGRDVQMRAYERRAALIAELDAREAADADRRRDGWPIVRTADSLHDAPARPGPRLAPPRSRSDRRILFWMVAALACALVISAAMWIADWAMAGGGHV